MPQRPIKMERPDLQAEDQQDFLQLYHHYIERVYRYVMARLGNHAEAEDLTSQVFLEAFKARARLREVENLPAWLFTIARNKVVDVYRKDKREPSLESIQHIPTEHDDLLTELISDENQQRLAVVLARLNPEQLELLQLRYAGELTYRQIGELVGKSEAAVKMAIYRLLDQLQSEMEHQHE